MALGLLLQDPQDVQVLEAAFDHLRVTHSLLKDETQAIDHAPDQAWRLEDVEEGD